MKVALIAPIGTSPPVVTEAIVHVEGTGWDVTDLIIMGTNNEKVRMSAEAARAAVGVNRPNIRVHIDYLPYDDITNDEQALYFMRTLVAHIIRERDEFRVGQVHLCIAGGRKVQTAGMAVVAQFLNLSSVFHLIKEDVQSYNEDLERVWNRIREVFEADNRIEVYMKYRNQLDPVFFPHQSTIHAVDIILVPYPQEFLGQFLEAIENDAVYDSDMDIDVKRLLVSNKIMTEKGKKLYITRRGEILRNLFR